MNTRPSRGQHSAARSGNGQASMTELARNIADSWDQVMASGLACYESWLRIVSTPFNATFGIDPRAFAAGDGERRTAVLPWVPKLDAQVIPFRRATDPPGSEGSRITMRVAVPAVFGAGGYTNTLSIDTLVPLPAADLAADAGAAAGSGEARPARA